MKFRIVIPALLLLGICFSFANKLADDPFSDLMMRMQEYNKKYAQEKVHLHLDKPYYAIGDNIWFKAYVVNTQTNEPTDISKALYVELINEENVVKTQLKLPIQAGISWGDFQLPDSLSGGNYRIRAYTQWMRNAGPAYFFDKTLKIGNSWASRVFTKTTYSFSKVNNTDQVAARISFTDKKGNPYPNSEVVYEVRVNEKSLDKGKAKTNEAGEINISFVNDQRNAFNSGYIMATLTTPDKEQVVKNIPLTSTSNTIDVQFFPEGGDLIQSLPNRVAIKAVNATGLGEDVTGTILDNDGAEITKLETKHKGMGSFILNPQPGKTYSAKVKFKDGSEKTFTLPQVQTSGYVLSVSNPSKDKISVKILLTEDLIGPNELKLVTQHSGNVYFTTKFSSKDQLISAAIPKNELPSGIVRFTLFNQANTPVCERLAFVNNTEDHINTTIENLKPSYAKRQKVDLNLLSKSGEKPLRGSFSIAVTNTASVKPDLENESNIFTTMLLTSELSGYIEAPNYYFLNDNEETVQNLDNLMLTQGWRRILWKDIISNTPPVYTFTPEKTIGISGTITSYGGKPLPNSKVSLFSSSKGFFAIDTLTDAQGRFNFDNLIYTDSIKFIVQGRTAKDKKQVDIKLDVFPGQIVTKNKNTGDITVNVNEALQGYLQRSSSYFDELVKRGLLERTLMLKEVSIAKKKSPSSNSQNMNGPGRADNVIMGEKLEDCPTLLMCLEGRIVGVVWENGVPYMRRNMTPGGGPMNIYLDGVAIEPDLLGTIMPSSVESIEILKSVNFTFLYGPNGSNGVIVITSKKGGSYSPMIFAPGIITYSPKGYHVARKFYSPKYDTPAPERSPDLRTTVYWQPHLATDVEGKGQFSFFNTDETGTYRIVVEGIDKMGSLARAVYTYEVK